MRRILSGAFAALFMAATWGCSSQNVTPQGGFVLKGARPNQTGPRADTARSRGGGLTPPSGYPRSRPAPGPAYPTVTRPPTPRTPGAGNAPVAYPPPAAGIGSPPPGPSSQRAAIPPGSARFPPPPSPPSPIFAPITVAPQPAPRPLPAQRPLGEKQLALDTDADGIPDTWFQISDGRITRVSRDTDKNGKADFTAHFSRDQGLPVSEVQYKGDTGQVTLKTEFEEGIKTKREADENGDGNPDHWWYYLGGRLSKEAWDRDADGKIEEVRRYRSEQVVRVEYDEDRDGKFEKSELLENGVRISSEIADGDGLLTLFYGSKGERVIRRERDRNGDGVTDIVVVLDPVTGVQVRQDRDLNGDGRPDVSAYYEGGKLARREISGDYLRTQKVRDAAAPGVDVEKRDFRKQTDS